jgi:hypothetical protein
VKYGFHRPPDVRSATRKSGENVHWLCRAAGVADIGGVADNLPHFFVDSLLVRRLLQMWQCFRLLYFFGKNLFYLIF